MGLTIFTLGCVILGNAIDFITTRIALREGAYEQNPLLRRSLGVVKIVGTIVQLAILLLSSSALGLVVGGFCIFLFYSAVGAWNIRQVHRIREARAQRAFISRVQALTPNTD